MKVLNRLVAGLLLAICAVGTFSSPIDARARQTPDGLPTVAITQLPKQAQETIALIKAGGPYPYKRDGVVFSNREKLLPKERRGFYKEYTVKTPGSKNRGARRIVTANQDTVFYYTDDHYASFKRVLEK
jgi:ribonuclease T1